MTALSIAIPWLTLAGAGFAALSAIGRVQARNDSETVASLAGDQITRADMWPAVPGAWGR